MIMWPGLFQVCYRIVCRHHILPFPLQVGVHGESYNTSARYWGANPTSATALASWSYGDTYCDRQSDYPYDPGGTVPRIGHGGWTSQACLRHQLRTRQ